MATTAEILVREGWTILIIVKGGRAQAMEHIQSLAVSDRSKVFAFLKRTAGRGPLGYSDERSKKLTDHIFELKPTAEVRLPYFFDGPQRIVITHAFTKKRGKTPPGEIARAQTIRYEYLGGK